MPKITENSSTRSKLTFILGGARSGKSAYAEEQARAFGRRVLFVATATAGDAEMEERIQKHRASRPAEWETLEAPLKMGHAIQSYTAPVEIVILDCMTLLVSNILLQLPENPPADMAIEKVSAELDALLQAYSKIGGHWLIISNEVGLGLVPVYPLGRIYRDALGWTNQRLAKVADQVILMVAGIPTFIKG